LRLNEWALSGDWTVKNQAAVLNKPNGRIAYSFHARDLHLVMAPAEPGTSVRFRVLIDGQRQTRDTELTVTNAVGVNLPNYASAIVTTKEVVDSIASL
jgi:hypothetical protein